MHGQVHGQNRGMQGLLTFEGQTDPATREAVEQHLKDQAFFWLDLDGVDDEARDLLLQGFKIHPLAVEDAQKFNERPKVENYDDFTYLVVYGAGADLTTTEEVHFIFGEHFVITVHRGACGAMVQARQQIGHHRATEFQTPQIALIYLVITQLVDSFLPNLNSFDNQIDDLEDAILVQPTDAQLGTLFSMKRQLINVRKVITPERECSPASPQAWRSYRGSRRTGSATCGTSMTT